MEQVIEAWNDEHIELPENALMFTFDDGYIDNYLQALPVLSENNIQGSFFIPGKTFTENILLDVNKVHFILASAPIESLVNELLLRIGLSMIDELCEIRFTDGRVSQTSH